MLRARRAKDSRKIEEASSRPQGVVSGQIVQRDVDFFAAVRLDRFPQEPEEVRWQAPRDLFRGAAWRPSSRPATPSLVYRSTHRSTVGKDTPANTATSMRRRPSAIHNTIRARVATTADPSRRCTNAFNSDRSSSPRSTPVQRQTGYNETAITTH